jgi:hypothetical protein
VTLTRRDFVKATAALAAALATGPVTFGERRAIAQIVRGPRTFETGLANFVARWEVAAPIIQMYEETKALARFIVNRTFNCETSDRPGSMHITLTTLNGELGPGPVPTAFMTIRMSEQDWVATTFGPYHTVAVALAERTWFSKDHMNAAFVLGSTMNLLAQIDGLRTGEATFRGEIPELNLDARCAAGVRGAQRDLPSGAPRR